MAADRILVTGATGFVGSHVVDRLLERGERVRVMVRATSDLRWIEGKPVERVRADLRDPDSLRPAVEGTRAVLHLGGRIRARSAREFMNANAEGTERLARAFRDAAPPDGSGVFLYCSSLAAGGPAPPEPRQPFPHVREDDPPRPVSPYGRSKREGERRLAVLEGRARVVIVRPPPVYGSRDTGILRFFRMLERGWLLIPARRGAHFSLVYVSDLVEMMMEALDRTGSRGTYYVSDGRLHTWEDLGQLAARIQGVRPRTIHIPMALAWMVAAGAEGAARLGGPAPWVSFGKVREMRQLDWVCLPDKAGRDFGFAPRVDLERGIEETIGWYRSVGWLSGGS